MLPMQTSMSEGMPGGGDGEDPGGGDGPTDGGT